MTPTATYGRSSGTRGAKPAPSSHRRLSGVIPEHWPNRATSNPCNDFVVGKLTDALYVLSMIAVVVGIDVLFFRGQGHFWERLAVNVGIVLVFGAFYFRFLRHA